MAAEAQPLPQIRAEDGPAPPTADQSYWQTFKNQTLIPSAHNSSVTSITTGSIDTFTVTAGARVQLYNSRTRKIAKTITRFNVDDVARSGILRRDGRILLAAGDSGIIQAFDTGSRAILRQWGREEKKRQPVHCVRWSPSDLTTFMSCGDDNTVRVWDLTEESPKWIGRAHEGYVRCGCWLPGQNGMLVSGSYDATVRVWNTTTGHESRPTMSFKLPEQVEDVLALNGSTVAAASGNTVTILNLISAKADIIIRSHQRAVSKMVLAQKGTRLLTAALDGHVKIHSTESWEVVASIKYTAPILSLAIVTSSAGEERHLAVGLQSGLLSIRTRIAGAEKEKVREREKRMQAMIEGVADEYDRAKKKKDMRQGIRARDRGLDYTGEGADIIIVGNARRHAKKLRGWQKSLRDGEYSKALDEALNSFDTTKGFDFATTLTIFTALRHRSALRFALANRSEEQLTRIFEWILKYIDSPRALSMASDVLLILLDLYSYKFAEWQESDSADGKSIVRMVHKIKIKVCKAVDVAEKAEGFAGMLSLLTAGG